MISTGNHAKYEGGRAPQGGGLHWFIEWMASDVICDGFEMGMFSQL